MCVYDCLTDHYENGHVFMGNVFILCDFVVSLLQRALQNLNFYTAQSITMKMSTIGYLSMENVFQLSTLLLLVIRWRCTLYFPYRSTDRHEN